MMRFLREESGQGMVEYGLILGLIAIVAIAALTATGSTVGDIFNAIKDKLSGVQSTISGS